MIKKTSAILIIAALAFGSFAGCRSPEEAYIGDFDDFDASIDDAGPGAACPEGTPDLFNNAYSPYIGGEEEVLLEVVNISYFRCPHCASFSDEYDSIWSSREDFRKYVRLYYHHYPFSNESAWRLHAMTVAAGNQGMENFWAVHDFLYDGITHNDPSVYYSESEVSDYVQNVLYLDMAQFTADMESEATFSFLEWDKGQALDQGISGTPAIFVCGEKRSYAQIESVVDSFLSNALGD